MPGLDKTGPQGEGPMTGRKVGFLGDRPGMRRGWGKGQGRGFFRGGCCFRSFRASITAKEELELLKEEAAETGKDLEEINARIKELEKAK